MAKFTSRTLWPLALTLAATFGLSIGLTWRSDHYCYAGTCGSWLFPTEARRHVGVWYAWLSISVAVLTLRARSPSFKHFVGKHLMDRKLPVLGKHLALSGLLIALWIMILYGALIANWWVKLHSYFNGKGLANGISHGNNRLAAIALTGHVCDVTMGMVLLPISRHSALAAFFKLSVSTTLAFHMIMAYTLFALVTTHMLLYVSWIPVFAGLNSTLQRVFPVLNPTYLYDETWPGNTDSLGIWRASLPFTGLFTTVIMFIVFLTTFPRIRQNHFNLFYFTHLFIILGLVVICLHASTMFYCCSPGLVLWVFDWCLRLYDLKTNIPGSVTTIGKGYYILTMKMPRRRLLTAASNSPLAHFYIYHSESSIRELHPFTTITHLASSNVATPLEEEDIVVEFLFRKRGRNVVKNAAIQTVTEVKKGWVANMRALIAPAPTQRPEWTARLAGRADSTLDTEALATGLGTQLGTQLGTNSGSPSAEAQKEPYVLSLGPEHAYPIINVSLRLEGPYFTPAKPQRYRTVISLVAGTGVSGAIAISSAFRSTEKARRERVDSYSKDIEAGGPTPAIGDNEVWERCVVLWTVRAEDYVTIPHLRENEDSALQVRTHLTGPGRPRLDCVAALQSIMNESPGGSVWVYISGPNPFIAVGEAACRQLKIDFYGARWDI